MNPVTVALIANSALYLAGCIAAGLATQRGVAWRLGIADAGVLYLGYLAQFNDMLPARFAQPWVALTVVLGAAAGIALLF